ncbi:GutQ Predicted sugar phosphate isomerase involved in capsule formation [Paracoccaceae bacterium]
MMPNSDKSVSETASRVISIEADALYAMARKLPRDFTSAVHAILQTRGRVIVSGVGKSGHIAKKIAATLASTGTPASFVHATEANHGDLGMVTAADICLIISNSGETSELSGIVNHTRRLGILLIAISSNPDSTLMRASDYKLVLIRAPEACSIGLAPTTSTTLALALGDALAVALMEQRGFQPENFKLLHPAGSLGAKLTRVEQLMHQGDALPVVDHHTSMQIALVTMTSKGFGIAAVIKDGTLMGVISDGDLRRHMGILMSATAGEIANKTPVTVAPDAFAIETLSIMNSKRINAILVVDAQNKLLGILHIHDLLRLAAA